MVGCIVFLRLIPSTGERYAKNAVLLTSDLGIIHRGFAASRAISNRISRLDDGTTMVQDVGTGMAALAPSERLPLWLKKVAVPCAKRGDRWMATTVIRLLGPEECSVDAAISCWVWRKMTLSCFELPSSI
jgi:hypothetical protein